MMKLNNATEYTWTVIVNVKMNNDDYQVCKVNVKDTVNCFDKLNEKFTDGHFHPSEEFAEFLSKKYSFIDSDDIDYALVSFIFVDNIPTVEL